MVKLFTFLTSSDSNIFEFFSGRLICTVLSKSLKLTLDKVAKVLACTREENKRFNKVLT